MYDVVCCTYGVCLNVLLYAIVGGETGGSAGVSHSGAAGRRELSFGPVRLRRPRLHLVGDGRFPVRT